MTGRKSSYYSNTLLAAVGSLFILAGCEDGQGFNPFKPRVDSAVEEVAEQSRTRTVERDVEAPDIFQKTDRGLWDGRPSIGGVWVAHADVAESGRVIIRNEADGKFVVGALFRRERITPGPAFQISSEAAAALGMLAGQPAQLSVTALNREEILEEVNDDTTQSAIENPDDISSTPLDPIAAAAAAIDGTDAPSAPPASAPTASNALSKPYIQIGIFSVETNANNTATAMHTAGLTADVRSLMSNGREFWRVVVGPSATSADRAALLGKVKDLGFTDAYFVRR
ncbi:SPOR domain-containing protein [Halocynthiibacter namhaensis]|uniref:SPOR domain-containing protein n=1 Tax=Halocynthiibacter namhaensis TaxID=1290553 RepID=UPI000579039F|nr:SPOR domain-containing protein [Halocynthiibacter namhaensis]